MYTLYDDDFYRITTDGKAAFFCNAFCQYFVTSDAVGKYIVNRLQQNEKAGYKLMDYIEIIRQKKGRKSWKNCV